MNFLSLLAHFGEINRFFLPFSIFVIVEEFPSIYNYTMTLGTWEGCSVLNRKLARGLTFIYLVGENSTFDQLGTVICWPNTELTLSRTSCWFCHNIQGINAMQRCLSLIYFFLKCTLYCVRVVMQPESLPWMYIYGFLFMKNKIETKFFILASIMEASCFTAQRITSLYRNGQS